MLLFLVGPIFFHESLNIETTPGNQGQHSRPGNQATPGNIETTTGNQGPQPKATRQAT